MNEGRNRPEPKTLRIGNLTLRKGTPGFTGAWAAGGFRLGDVHALVSCAMDGTYFGWVDVGRRRLAFVAEGRSAIGVSRSFNRQMRALMAALDRDFKVDR